MTPPSKEPTDFLDNSEHGTELTKAIIDTIQEPLIILGKNLEVLAASRSFYKKFNLNIESVQGKMFYDLGGTGAWDIPELRKLLEDVLPQHRIVENYEIIHKFKQLGERTMLINAREINYKNDQAKMLISIFDITEQRKLEHDNENLAKHKDLLLKEMRHRIANSLQIIASVLLLKAQNVTSDETKAQLEDVHNRIMSIATVQGQLDPAGLDGEVDIPSYLNALCDSLAKSMLGDRRPISITVEADLGKATTDEAIGMGLITTELVINTLKHAFNSKESGEVIVTFKANGASGWKLSVKDNGQGISQDEMSDRKGLGAGIVDTLAKQLNAIINTESTSNGTTVSIIHSGQ